MYIGYRYNGLLWLKKCQIIDVQATDIRGHLMRHNHSYLLGYPLDGLLWTSIEFKNA